MPERRPLAADELTKLAKLLALLGSNHVGERAAAALKANELLAAAGWTWSEFVDGRVAVAPPPSPQPPPPEPDPEPARYAGAPPPWERSFTPQGAALVCLRYPEALTRWERDFCRNLAGRWRTTPKQRAVLDRLIRKCRAYAEASYA